MQLAPSKRPPHKHKHVTLEVVLGPLTSTVIVMVTTTTPHTPPIGTTAAECGGLSEYGFLDVGGFGRNTIRVTKHFDGRIETLITD
jgi:hypothetical protein